MPISKELFEILVCPQCKGGLKLEDEGGALLCGTCQLKYLVRNNIPVMLVSEAVDLRSGGKARDVATEVTPNAMLRIIITGGKEQSVELELGTCKAVGREIGDENKTMVFSVDIMLQLDESSKGLIQKYISSQFKAKEGMSRFVRTSDIVLEDTATSRLHAMFFYDKMGVGILDLVSRNGTYVNGKEVESRILNPGDVVEIGETKIIFEGLRT